MAMNTDYARTLLKQHGLTITEPRVFVLSLLRKFDTPMSINDIMEKSKHNIALSTLYRVLADLSHAKIVTTFSSPNQKLLVELLDEEREHHHHLYCESCEKVFDVSLGEELEGMIEKLISKIGETHQIDIQEHSFEMYGSCNNTGQHSLRRN
jgi:Fur family ferric uptake transcriptional regulator